MGEEEGVGIETFSKNRSFFTLAACVLFISLKQRGKITIHWWVKMRPFLFTLWYSDSGVGHTKK